VLKNLKVIQLNFCFIRRQRRYKIKARRDKQTPTQKISQLRRNDLKLR